MGIEKDKKEKIKKMETEGIENEEPTEAEKIIQKRKLATERRKSTMLRSKYLKKNVKDEEFSRFFYGELRDIVFSISKCPLSTTAKMSDNKTFKQNLSMIEMAIFNSYLGAADGDRAKLTFILDLVKFFVISSETSNTQREKALIESKNEIDVSKLSDDLVDRLQEEMGIKTEVMTGLVGEIPKINEK